MSDKATRVRYTMVLTRVYADALDQLIDEGLYMEQQVAIRAALRLLFRFHGIESFTDKGAEFEPETSDVSEP